MNLPNKLTILRVLMIPVFVVFMLLSTGGRLLSDVESEGSGLFLLWRILSIAVFLSACFTDFLDGFIARKYGLITDFGKFLDPLADKLLVCCALILFVAEGSLPVWVVLIIISREFIISAFRLVASDKGIVIAASIWGKIKTFFQMVLCICILIPGFTGFVGPIIMWGLIIIVVILTVVSLIDYIHKNISVLTLGGM